MRHRFSVWVLAFSPDGQQLATAGTDRAIRLWDVATGNQARQIPAHTRTIAGVAFSPDGSLLASCSHDHTVGLWPLNHRGGERPRTLTGHSASVNGVAFSPDGKILASGSSDRTVRLWDVATGKSAVLGPHPGRVNQVAFDPSGQRLGVPCSDGTVRIWSLADRSYRDLSGHHNEVNVLRFTAGGKMAVTVSDDSTVRTWDVAAARPHWRTVAVLPDPPRILTHLGWQTIGPASKRARPRGAWQKDLQQRGRRAVISPDKKGLCVQTDDGHLELWRRGTRGALFRVALSGLRDLVALSRGCVVLARGRVSLHGVTGAVKKIPGRVQALAPDREGFLVATKAGVTLYSPTGQQRASYMGAVGVTALIRSDRHLALGFKEGSIEVVPLDGPALAPPVRRPRFSFEEIPYSSVTRLRRGPRKTLVAGFANGSWGIWSVKTGKQFYLHRLHGPIRHLEISDRKLHVASALGQHSSLSLEVFHLKYCELMRRVWAEVPTEWEDGLPRLRPPPRDHACRK